MAVMPTNTGSPRAQGAEVLQAQVGDARPVARASQCRGHVQQLQRHLRVGRLETGPGRRAGTSFCLEPETIRIPRDPFGARSQRLTDMVVLLPCIRPTPTKAHVTGEQAGMSRVALVFPYFRTRSPTEMLFPPLGVATWPPSFADRARRPRSSTARSSRSRSCAGSLSLPPGHRRHLLDGEPDAQTLTIADHGPHTLPGSLLVAGGPLPTVFPRRYTESFDAVFRGEADLSSHALSRLLRARGAAPDVGGPAPAHLRRACSCLTATGRWTSDARHTESRA